jgi:hypothetical protein
MNKAPLVAVAVATVVLVAFAHIGRPAQAEGAAATKTEAAAPQAAPAPTPVNWWTYSRSIRILPGQWRPHYPWEQIAWISPPWPGQDYLWVDFPQALLADQGWFFLSHVNLETPDVLSDLCGTSIYPGLPRVEWQALPEGLTFERELPNGLRFGGSLTKTDDSTVAMEMHLHNGTGQPLTNIRLQTCLFLRASKEFGDYTRDNKFVHVPGAGWMSLELARELPQEKEKGIYTIGFRGRGRPLVDLPVIVCVSQGDPSWWQRLVAMTWYHDTASVTGNPNHPCMHADPKFPDLAPGESASVRGDIIFFEGTLSDFEDTEAFKRLAKP